MAHPSPSPSSSTHRRRLSEVLGEQQEPFSLDLYLHERGCSSPAFLDATACGGGACGSTCWPKTRGTCRTTLRRPARTKKGSRRSGVLRMLLSKILSGTAAPPATTKQNRQQRTAIVRWRCVAVAGKQRTPANRFDLAVRSPSPGAGAVEAHMEDDDGEQEDDDEDESSKKQLSPVSVLEHRPFEHSPPPPPHAPKSMAIFSELLEAAYTPNTLLVDDVLAIAKGRSSSTQSIDGRSTCSSMPPRTPRAWRRRRKKKKKKHAHARRKEDVAALEKDDLGRLTSLVASEMAGARSVVRAEDLRPSVEDVGALIAAALLEALTEETAAELMGTMDMDRG